MSFHMHENGDIVADRYKVLNYVGEGGMQQVFRADDRRLRRRVALKSPKNDSGSKRFERSAIVSARVNHPNVAKTLDYFETEEAPYLVEEYILGRDLQQVLVNEIYLIDPYLAARALHHMAKGIAASHAVGVVHRDMKPSNVMVLGNGGFAQFKITDFGIAKMAGDEIAEAAEGGEDSIAASKTMVGAIPYMAPEAIEDPRRVEKPGDVWALGAIMYELMSGEKPFGTGLKAVSGILAGKGVQWPDVLASNAQFRPLADELFEIVASCLQKNPKKRPTAEQLAEQCGGLCYLQTPRLTGDVTKMGKDGTGTIKDDTGRNVFFSMASVYGRAPELGSHVSFSKFPGHKAARAHPVLVLR